MEGGEAKPEEAKAGEGAPGDSDEEEGEDEKDPEQLKMDLLAACRENNMEQVEALLQEKNIEVVFKHDGWSPILWAACNGSEDICRLLIAKNACAPYLNK